MTVQELKDLAKRVVDEEWKKLSPERRAKICTNILKKVMKKHPDSPCWSNVKCDCVIQYGKLDPTKFDTYLKDENYGCEVVKSGVSQQEAMAWIDSAEALELCRQKSRGGTLHVCHFWTLSKPSPKGTESK